MSRYWVLNISVLFLVFSEGMRSVNAPHLGSLINGDFKHVTEVTFNIQPKSVTQLPYIIEKNLHVKLFRLQNQLTILSYTSKIEY